MTETSLTVMFENPFWIGLYERNEDGIYTASRVVFGAEPKDNEVYAYFLKNWSVLKFTPEIVDVQRVKTNINPKRLRREISRNLLCARVGTKAQQAFKLQQEQAKAEKKAKTRQRREEDSLRKYEMKKLKRIEKHKGK